MDTIDVPAVFELPCLAPNEYDAVAFADLILTALLTHDAALLCADHSHPISHESSAGWFIHPRIDGLYSAGMEIATSPHRSHFRAMLARFGAHYLGGQLYGGYALRFLKQLERVHRCHIYMSNNGQSGFWLKIYAGLN